MIALRVTFFVVLILSHTRQIEQCDFAKDRYHVLDINVCLYYVEPAFHKTVHVCAERQTFTQSVDPDQDSKFTQYVFLLVTK